MAKVIQLSQFDSPLGKIAVAERQGKVLAICFGGRRALREQHPELWEQGEIEEGEIFERAREVQRYLGGQAKDLRIPVDLSLVPGAFDRKVLQALVRVRSGETVNYGALAEKVGSPRAARAVGGAMSRNPIPILVPCHRVLPSTGGLGNYTGGVEKKAWLLKREGVSV